MPPPSKLPLLLGLVIGAAVAGLLPRTVAPAARAVSGRLPTATINAPKPDLTSLPRARGMERLLLLAEILASATGESFPDLAQNFLTSTPPPTPLEWRLLFRRWVDFDATAAFAFAVEQDTQPATRTAWAAIAWAEVDQSAAWAAMRAQPMALRLEVLRSIIQRDPHWAWAQSEALPEKDRLSATEVLSA